MSHSIELCSVNELSENTARGFSADETGADIDVFLVCQQGQVFGYVNSCPHTGAPLDWQPNQFLSLDKDAIQCSLHGARFGIQDGACLGGPCSGDGLSPIRISIEDQKVYWQFDQ